MITVNRLHSDDNGTFGEMKDDDENFLCYTCELPWKNNDHQTSCIPIGNYRVTKFESPTKGSVFLLHDVPNRSMIEIHAGNTIHDILGCICIGSAMGHIGNLPAVLHSQSALKMLLSRMLDEFELTIIGVPNAS